MDILNALIMGIVQGLAEYLPISSSGHLEICRELLGLDLSGAESLQFDVMLHVATVLSTIVILWHEFSGLCRSFFTLRRDDNTSLVCKILVSCIPVGIVGVFFKKQIEAFFGTDLIIVGACLCLTALLLTFSYVARRRLEARGTASGVKYTPRDITYFDAFTIGIAQAIAVLPGLSRSGSTIATGLALGVKRDQIANFSFLMVIIPILGQALLDIKDYITDPAATATAAIGIVPMIVGFLASFIVGCIACKWMINLVKRGNLLWFALYCLIIGIICIAH